MSRRGVLRVFASGAGASVLATTGLDRIEHVVAADGDLKLVKAPKLKRTSSGVEILVMLPAPSACVIEYGTTTALGNDVDSPDLTSEHTVELPNLEPGTRYYFRVVALTDNGPITSRIYKFNAPTCNGSATLCGGTCIPKCGPGATLDPASCTCVCSPGLTNCSGNAATGCETTLGTVDNCLGCGNSCDDGNACTENVCDPSTGCVATNIPDGTPCGTEGVCVNGTCADCVPGGTCGTDIDCCDDEACCGSVCVPRTALQNDINNCGACGVVCPDGPCQVASCVDGICQSAPEADGAACDDGNPCTVDDHCMAGTCMGNPAENGAGCNDGGICTDGTCVTCAPGQSCAADTDCCTDEICCGDVCVAKSALQDDPENCGACGTVCQETENLCEQVACKQGQCVIEDAEPGTACVDNPCVENGSCQDGVCQGSPVKEGTPCGVGGTCQDGTCVEPISFTAAVANTLFSDDFEGGSMAKWSTVSGVAAQSSVVAAGSYAARATGSGTVAYARTTLSTAQPEIFIRTRFKIISQGANSVYLLRTFKSSSSPLLSLFVTSSGRLATFNNATGATLTSATTVSKNTWHEVTFRVRVNSTQSLGTVWLNGSKIYDVSKTTNLGATGMKLVQIGDNVARRTFDVAFDDVAVCTGGLCPALPPATSSAPGATKSVLLSTYTHNSSRGGGVNWAKVIYRPRQMRSGLTIDDPTRGLLRVDNAGQYQGWDIFTPYNYSVHRIETIANWTVIEINRAATVAIVWRGGDSIPTWLSGWAKGGNVVVSGMSYPTFRKSFGQGKVSLGGVYSSSDSPGANATRDAYWVLLAESDGLASPMPAVPGGLAVPAPNATCPSWVHDQYTAVGPDGMRYPTWHHQIDPVYWCYHRHEHGTNWKWFGGGKKPVFGYTAAMHGMEEPHTGFKNHVFDSEDGTRWMITHHFGTAGLGRACNRFHTVDIAVLKISTGELLADLHFMGDFGKAVVNRTQAPLTPPTCPTQAADAAGSSGIRMIPSKADDAVGYEPWRVDLKQTIFGFIADFTINNPDGIVICNNSTCDQAVSTGNSGTFRFFTPNGDSAGTRFSLVAGKSTGEFFTDIYGRQIVDQGEHGAVRQYIKPGARMQVLSPGIHYYDVYAWGRKIIPSESGTGPASREGSVQAPN
jgi:hypothetical protein